MIGNLAFKKKKKQKEKEKEKNPFQTGWSRALGWWRCNGGNIMQRIDLRERERERDGREALTCGRRRAEAERLAAEAEWLRAADGGEGEFA